VITIGGVLINPGDTIVGYLDGVLVVPIVLIEEAIENQLQEKYNRKI
jgi:regulator of RNase E activity RraA